MWCRGIGHITTRLLSLLATPLATDAQQATQVHRIALLRSGSPPRDTHLLEAFRQGLRALDYVEGQNLVIEDRYAEGRDERLPDLATELVRLPVDVIVAGGSHAIRAAQAATRTIPIVMAGTGDPVGQGFIASLAHPGGNITGLSALGAELPGKRLELLKETVPQSTRIAVLISAARPGYVSAMRNLTVAATALGLHLHVVELRQADEVDSAFAAMTQAGADALLVIDDSQLLNRQRARVVANLAAQHRLPAMRGWREYVDAGLLMSYGPSQLDMQRRTAVYVAKILKGAKPVDLAVEQPTKFELVINLKTAQALGITIPPALLILADEVIQ
jgi:putative tryptophan/tyrosine transport system substrate-binding protein